MRRSIVGILAGWVVGATCVSAQTPLPNGSMDGPPLTPPPAGAGSSFSPYGHYSQSAHFDAAAFPDQPRQGYSRANNGATPAGGQSSPNGNVPAMMPNGNPNYVPPMMPNGNNGPVMPNGYAGPMPNGYAGPMPNGYAGPVQNGYPGPMQTGYAGAMQNGYPVPMPNNYPGQIPNGYVNQTGNGVQFGNGSPMPSGNGVQIGNGAPMGNGNVGPMGNNYGGAVFSNGPIGVQGSSCVNGNCNLPCDQGCGCPTACGPKGKFWFSAEYLLWWSSGMGLPPLVTGAPPGTVLNVADPAGGAAIPVAGAIGQPTTTVLFGGDANDTVRSGLRLRAGMWFDDNNMLGFDGSFFFLGDQNQSYMSQSLANNIVMRPFFNASTGREDAEIVNYPGILSGTVTINTRNDVYGADANLRRNLCCGCNYRIDLIGGYRYFSVNDRLDITENLTSTSTTSAVPVGTTLVVNDHFETDNQFHGGQIGLAGEYRMGNFYFDWRGLVAIGPSIKTIRINGTTTVTTPGGVPTTSVGGLLAQPTNIGTYTSTDFSVLPELGLNFGYQVTSHIRVFAGYSFLYWNNVARAGNQIDFAVNSTQIPPGVLVGPANPAFRFVRSDYWLQGLNFGAEVRF